MYQQGTAPFLVLPLQVLQHIGLVVGACSIPRPQRHKHLDSQALQPHLGGVAPLLIHPVPDAGHHLVLLLLGKHAGHLSAVQQVVNVLKETLVGNLVVRQQEHDWLPIHTSCTVQLLRAGMGSVGAAEQLGHLGSMGMFHLEVLPELCHAIATSQLKLEAFEAAHGCCKARQALLAAAAHAHLQAASAWRQRNTPQSGRASLCLDAAAVEAASSMIRSNVQTVST